MNFRKIILFFSFLNLNQKILLASVINQHHYQLNNGRSNSSDSNEGYYLKNQVFTEPVHVREEVLKNKRSKCNKTKFRQFNFAIKHDIFKDCFWKICNWKIYSVGKKFL